MRTLQRTSWAVFCMMLIIAPIARAQQQSQPVPADQAAPPIPAYRSPLASAANNGDDDGLPGDPSKLNPDSRSLTGAQEFTLGELASKHSYWQPHVNFTSTLDSNGLSSTTNTGWTTWSTFNGGIDLHRISGNSDLSLLYSGGASVSNDGSSNNGIVQNMQFAERIGFRRATLSLLDQLSYLPENGLGSQFDNIGTPLGIGSIGLQPGLIPGQSILTTRGQRLSNSLVPEVDVKLTGRTSLTFVGSYTLLHFFDNALLNYYNVGFSAGYNHQITRKDTIAVSYSFSAFRYTNFNQSIDDHVVYLSYGRRVTGKLAFQIAAGPEYASFAMPITGTSNAGTGTLSGSSSHLSWALNTSLTYQLRRMGLGLSYAHGVSGGSGVLAGSVADTVSGSLTRPLSRTFSGNWSVSYGRNNGLTVNGPGTPTANQTFDYWSSNVGLSHPMGRTMTLGLSYLFQYQNSNAAFCVGPTCGSSLVRHEILFTLGWHDHPIPF